MRHALFSGLMLALCAASAHAQAPANPILDNYRAYTAALERNDLEAAETAAAAALAASQARDGDGGRTGVLSLNLALVRLERANAAGAQEPAAHALAIAQARPNAGVDPLMARLALGQAELAIGNGEAGRDRLTPALTEAEGKPELSERVIASGNALGRWAFGKEQYALARTSFGTAARAAAGDDALSVFLRARAHTGEAASLVMAGQNRRNTHRDEGVEAYGILDQVLADMGQLTQTQAADGRITSPQRAYAEALAWRSILYIFYDNLPQTLRRITFDTPSCRIRRDPISDLTHYFPHAALDRGQQGVVVFRLTFDASGQLKAADIAAAAPERFFPEAATQLVHDFNFRVEPNNPAGCVMRERVEFLPIDFRFG